MINPNHIGVKYSLFILGMGRGGGASWAMSLFALLYLYFQIWIITLCMTWLFVVSNRDICYIKLKYYSESTGNFSLNFTSYGSTCPLSPIRLELKRRRKELENLFLRKARKQLIIHCWSLERTQTGFIKNSILSMRIVFFHKKFNGRPWTYIKFIDIFYDMG